LTSSDVHLRHLILATLTAVCTLPTWAAPALADSVALTVTTPTGVSDPAAFLPRVFTVSGTATSSEFLYLKHHAAGDAPCAASPYLDSGALWTGFYGLAVSGGFSFQKTITWDAPGTWTFCLWLSANERTAAAATSQAIAFRWPAGTMSARVKPAVPRPDQWAHVTVSGWSEAPRLLYAKVRPAKSGPCAQTYDADPGRSVIGGDSAIGTFVGRGDIELDSEGQYVICSWLAGSSSDPSPIGGPVAQLFAVAQPRPVLATAIAMDCESHTYLRRFRAARPRAVCMRYRFTTSPATDERVSVAFFTPKGHRYKTVTWKWPNNQAQTMTSRAGLPAGAFKDRRGTWRAVLRIGARKINTATFRVD
jgi:hypothetical protein